MSGEWQYIDHGGNAVFVWFGGIHEKHLWCDFLRDESIDALTFIDAKFNWYVDGIQGVPGGFFGAIDHIRALCDGKKIIVAGQSSGGYAALRFSLELNPALCIAFAPQTGNRPGLKDIPQPAIPIPDVAGAYVERQPEFPVVIHMSRSETSHKEQFFWNDWAHVMPMIAHNNTRIVIHPTDMHAVAMGMHKRFRPTILSAIDLYVNHQP